MGIVNQSESDRAVGITSNSAGVQRVVKMFEYSN
jgi:osmotically-inducible protein OsmY